eukprot:TRINITY_DN13664_c0_g1_i1.p2 TRINITY_DN13664_c0_g1~~TRINITY_DN13664_c0_g1_i1.p2  ORF type:complete len:135 (-),score=24.89 TRINITY_DN13664_c0_g1_i1:380-784(-)
MSSKTNSRTPRRPSPSTNNPSPATIFFFQAEDGIRDHAQSRGLGDVYKRQNRPLAENCRQDTIQTSFSVFAFEDGVSIKIKRGVMIQERDSRVSEVQCAGIRHKPQLLMLLSEIVNVFQKRRLRDWIKACNIIR